ncbi:carboxylating nicotinate-nucleotide diphosphorylase [Halalkalibaculum sp. DA384]|uniref:carboxylating nicotinate-nucleotide diphosphorylase n=1 Tax=Halalkalibaculum sp. DA384 TaxID=3373606 RepID=UPI003754DF05
MEKLKLRDIIAEALEEDLGMGDLTSSFFAPDHISTGFFTAKADGVLAGLDIITETYRLLDERIEVDLYQQDGDRIEQGEEIAEAEGPTAPLLSGERVILNLLQHMSGIATGTKRAVEALHSSHTRVCDTRKTLPGLRMLQKYAVRCGGGYNHRYRLDDGVMLKDNHIKAAGGISRAVSQLRNELGLMVRIEVETETRDQVLESVESGADIIMFDNQAPPEVKQLVELVPDHIITEISGGITIDTIGDYRDTGVDYISMGSLTHSVTALDISFNLND